MECVKRYLSLVCLCVCVSECLLAVPASPVPFAAMSSDGSPIEVMLNGDEFCNWYTDSAGNLLIKDDGRLRVATAAEQTALAVQRRAAAKVREENTGRALQRMTQKTQVDSSFPKKGTVKVLVLLTQYADRQLTVTDPVNKFTRLFNQEHYSDNGSTGSVADYYKASSAGALNLQFDVYGPFTLSREEEYYGGNSSKSSSRNAQTLVKEAVQLAYEAGVNLSQYDNTGRGQIDNISIITAGYSEAEGGGENCIWPHQSFVWNSVKIGDVYLGSYLMTSELRGANGANMTNIGVYCHEFGHVLGLPDLYNTSDDEEESRKYTVGSWDIMCSGPYNNLSRTPPVYSAFERFMLGWLKPVQLQQASRCVLEPIETTNTAYMVAATTHNLSTMSPSPNEYFMIENRQHAGWDTVSSALPGVGLLISHITFSSSAWDNNTFNNSTPLGYDIIEAATAEPTSSLASDTYPGAANVTSWTPVLNSGHLLEQYAVNNIFSRSDGSVSFLFGDMGDVGLFVSPSQPDTLKTTFDTRVSEYIIDSVVVTGKGLAAPAVNIGVSGRFRFSIDGEEWHASGSVLTDSTVNNGTYSRKVYLRYHPVRQSCSASTGVLSVFSSDSLDYATVSLAGISPRPILITAVDSVFIDEITETSLRVSWTAVEDAEFYNVKLWKVTQSDGDTSYVLHHEYNIPEFAASATFNNLEPGTLYVAQVMPWEQKSCFANYAEARYATAQTMLQPNEGRTPIAVMDDGSFVFRLNYPLAEDMTMAVFADDGSLVVMTTASKGSQYPIIPTQTLTRGRLYLIKMYSGKSYRRKDIWGKLLF